jgi:thiol-disulfide isomerase/thioredoxin
MASPNPLIPHLDELASTIEMSSQDVRTKAALRLLDEVRGSVVQVSVITDPVTDKRVFGDGFFINDGTEIVTSNFLIQNAYDGKSIEVLTHKGETFSAQIEKRENGHDEVVLKLPTAKSGTHKALKLGPSGDLVEGEALYLYGHKDINDFPILAAGRMNSHYRQKLADGEKHQFIDCLMPKDIGKSGSPLLNSDGEVVGIYQGDYVGNSDTKNILVKFDDVYELQKMTNPNMQLPKFEDVVDLDDTTQQEAAVETAKPFAEVKKPSTEQLEAIEAKFGKIVKPTVIEFEADWCVYCKKQEPLLNKAEKTYGQDINVVRLNIDKDENADLAAAYEVKGLPCTIFIGVSPDGEILRQETLTGYGPGTFQQLIDQLMADRVKDKKAQ